MQSYASGFHVALSAGLNWTRRGTVAYQGTVRLPRRSLERAQRIAVEPLVDEQKALRHGWAMVDKEGLRIADDQRAAN